MAPKTGTARRLTRLPLTEARIHLGAVVKRARLGKEYFILEKDGIPVAGLMDIDEFEDYLELQDPEARADIERSTKEHRAGKSRPIGEFVAKRPKAARKTATRRRRA